MTSKERCRHEQRSDFVRTGRASGYKNGFVCILKPIVLKEREVKALPVCLASLILVIGPISAARAQEVTNDAYARDASSQVIKNGFGECWRTSSWAADKAIAGCDAVPAPRVTPKAAVPAAAAALSFSAAPAAPVAPPAPQVVDSDGDGVPDNADQCPGTPAGARVNAQGCELDTDGDGVVDRLDQCPNTVSGAKVDARGCELDSDGDGVVDRLDKCPGTKPGVKVGADGCEIPEVTVLKGVNFAFKSASLTPEAMAILDQVAITLSRRGDSKAEVLGHTDNVGTAERNLKLSQERAEAVMRYLVSKGVKAESLTARGLGEAQPIADNKTEAGRAQNRRVELRTLR